MREALLEKTQEYYNSDEYGEIICDGLIAIQTEALVAEKLDGLPHNILEKMGEVFDAISARAACAEEFIKEIHMEKEYNKYLLMTGL